MSTFSYTIFIDFGSSYIAAQKMQDVFLSTVSVEGGGVYRGVQFYDIHENDNFSTSRQTVKHSLADNMKSGIRFIERQKLEKAIYNY